MIDWRTSYDDLSNEVEILEIRKDGIMQEMKIIRRYMDTPPRAKLVANYSGMPSGSGVLSFERLSNQYCALQAVLDDVDDILSLKHEVIKRMEERIEDFKGIEYKVVVMRDIQKKPLTVIADELDYSYAYIRKISMGIKSMYKTNVRKGTIREQIG